MLRLNAQTIAAAITADRVRIDNILSSPEAKRNPALAQRLAVVRGMDEATAREVLAVSKPENAYLAALEMHGAVPVPGVPQAGATVLGGQDAKSRRLAEIKENVRAYNVGMGYRTAESYARGR